MRTPLTFNKPFGSACVLRDHVYQYLREQMVATGEAQDVSAQVLDAAFWHLGNTIQAMVNRRMFEGICDFLGGQIFTQPPGLKWAMQQKDHRLILVITTPERQFENRREWFNHFTSWLSTAITECEGADTLLVIMMDEGVTFPQEVGLDAVAVPPEDA